MLKHHTGCIDLGRNVLKFPMVGGGAGTEFQLLHETVSPLKKGGTTGFDAEKENALLRIGGRRKRVQVRSVVETREIQMTG